MKKDSTIQKGERTLFQLWGCDTFSNEVYNCGVYKHRSSAYRAKRKHEEDVAKTQSIDLRDSFWIVPITESGYISQRKERQHEIEMKSELRDTNQAFIRENANVISNGLLSIAEDTEYEMLIKMKIRTRKDYEERNLISVPEDLMIESIFIQITKDEGKDNFKFYFGIKTKEVPYAAGNGTTLIYICSGSFDDFKVQLKRCVSPNWISSVLNRIIEKNIYETY